MIALDAFLVFLAAVSLPAIYVFILSRWIEPEYRQIQPGVRITEMRPAAEPEPVRKAA